jgi:hypothetical protein
MQQEKQGEKHRTNKDGKGIKIKIVQKAVNTKLFLPRRKPVEADFVSLIRYSGSFLLAITQFQLSG